MKLLDRLTGRDVDQGELARRYEREREQRNWEKRQADLRRIREEKAERERKLAEARERREAQLREQANRTPRPVVAIPQAIPRPAHQRGPEAWAEQERQRHEAEQRERERSAQVEAERHAAADRKQAAQRAWAERRNELTSRVREAELAMQSAEADLRDAVGAGDVERAGAAKQKLEGALAIRDAAQTEVDRHQHSQPGVRLR